jgi:hypothetical protein
MVKKVSNGYYIVGFGGDVGMSRRMELCFGSKFFSNCYSFSGWRFAVVSQAWESIFCVQNLDKTFTEIGKEIAKKQQPVSHFVTV